MKFLGLLLLLVVSFEAYFSLLFFYFTHISNNKAPTIPKVIQDLTLKVPVPQNQIVDQTLPGLPVQLIIPDININVNIQDLGVTPNGEMDVPDNIIDAGWFKFGSRPGEKGSAVIAGHLDGRNGKGVFIDLNKLKKGDKLYIKDDNGKFFIFIVREIHTYDPNYDDENIFSLNDKAHLNLITCDGVWDTNKKIIVSV
jgi:LPXTG-site transpeptidase (sortase) family protein